MQAIEILIKNKRLSNKDVIVYLLVEKLELRTAKELSNISDLNYSRLTESLNVLIEHGLIEKTKEYPVRYIVK